jgi:hypothetical protein
MTRPDDLATFDRAPTPRELIDLLVEVLEKRPDVETHSIVVEIDGAIAELCAFRLAVSYPDPETEDPKRFLVLAGIEVGDYRKVIREVAENRAWYEDGYGQEQCFYCSAGGLEHHEADCIWVLARKLVNLDPPAGSVAESK